MKEYIIISYLIGLGMTLNLFKNDLLTGLIVFLVSPILVPVRIGLKLME